MADNGDLKSLALITEHDFYALLGLEATAADSEIGRAWRRTALKYHPDKVGASDTTAREKFDLVQQAHDLLRDPVAREIYDNARRAREQKKERDAGLQGHRKKLKEDLERRENAGIKRKREDEALEKELERLAADGARRRKEREEQLRREEQERRDIELQNLTRSARTEQNEVRPDNTTMAVEDIDRTIKFRYPADISELDKEEVMSRFNRFGEIEDVVMRSKKIKIEGEKHRKEYTTVLMLYKSIVGAHAAISNIPDLAKTEEDWTVFEAVNWAAGKEPECIAGGTKSSSTTISTAAAMDSPAFDELFMIRLQNAEKKRQANIAKKKKEQEQEAQV